VTPLQLTRGLPGKRLNKPEEEEKNEIFQPVDEDPINSFSASPQQSFTFCLSNTTSGGEDNLVLLQGGSEDEQTLELPILRTTTTIPVAEVAAVVEGQPLDEDTTTEHEIFEFPETEVPEEEEEEEAEEMQDEYSQQFVFSTTIDESSFFAEAQRPEDDYSEVHSRVEAKQKKPPHRFLDELDDQPLLLSNPADASWMFSLQETADEDASSCVDSQQSQSTGPRSLLSPIIAKRR
jgi:hypothetical protein